MRTTDNLPAFHRSVVRLACSACGAEANASCSCGKPYVPAQQRVAEYDRTHPGRSTRQAAADLDVSKSEVSRARQSGVPSRDTSETVTGRDGKSYPASNPKRRAATYEPEPGEDDLVDFVVEHFMRLSPAARVRCADRLRKIMDGKS